MNVVTLNEASEEEQLQDLRCYFKSLSADISEQSSVEGLDADLYEIINVCDVCFKETLDSDIEATLNSIVSLLIMVPPDKNQQLILMFCEKMLTAPTTKIVHVCLRVLQNLYAAIGENSLSCYDVYYSLVKLAGQTDSIQSVFKDIEKLKVWLVEMKISTERKQKLLRALHEILVESKQSELSSKIMIELLGTYTEDNASQARDDAHRCIVASLGDPNTFLMDHLLTLKPVRFLEGELIHDLLTIFVSEKLSSYLMFYAANKDFVHSLGLSHEQNLQKMRLLTFMQMAETQKEISFEMIEKELQISPEDVEGFIIDVLRTKLVRAKVDQPQKKILVSSTIHRTFGRPQWQQLRETLLQWRINLSHVEGSIEEVIRAQYATVPPMQG